MLQVVLQLLVSSVLQPSLLLLLLTLAPLLSLLPLVLLMQGVLGLLLVLLVLEVLGLGKGVQGVRVAELGRRAAWAWLLAPECLRATAAVASEVRLRRRHCCGGGRGGGDGGGGGSVTAAG